MEHITGGDTVARGMTDEPPVVIACRPRDLDLTNEMDALIAKGTFVYEGSVEGCCDLCEQAVHVGPNQSALLLISPETLVVCFRCVAVMQNMDPEPFDIRSLDNPEPPPEWVEDLSG